MTKDEDSVGTHGENAAAAKQLADSVISSALAKHSEVRGVCPLLSVQLTQGQPADTAEHK